VVVKWLNKDGGNSNIFGMFTPNLGEDFQFDYYFSDGLKPPTRRVWEMFSPQTKGEMMQFDEDFDSKRLKPPPRICYTVMNKDHWPVFFE